MTSHSGGTTVTDTATNTGFTAAVRVEIPVFPSVRATGQFRWVHFPETTVHIPGAVPIQTDAFYTNFGVTIPFTPPPPPSRRNGAEVM